MKNFAMMFTIVFACVSLAGCGNKGPLVRPSDIPATTPVVKPAATPAAGEPAAVPPATPASEPASGMPDARR